MAEEVEECFELTPHGCVEGVELVGPVDLDVHDEGSGRGHVEVWCFRSVEDGHVDGG